MSYSLSSDRNLLFGILALQVNFIDRDALVAAMHTWVLDKKKALGQVLLEQGRLSSSQLQVLDALLKEHLATHGDEVESSLAALSNKTPVRSTLASIDDDDLQGSLAKFDRAAEADSTRAYAQHAGNGVRYRRLRPHAAGGLGQVFVAEDTELHREVALKEIRKEHADEPESRGRFVMEAEITGGLEHPGIVPVYGLGAYDDGRPYYAMRFIRGDSLKEAIDRFHAADKAGRKEGERSLEFRQLLRRYVDVCNAVAYAHSRGVLHRDLKPSNVMLGKFGETLVVDWGLAKAGIQKPQSDAALDLADGEGTLRPSSGSSIEKTQAGITLGTIHFMSPEQAAGRLSELAPTSDIFSLGSTLYVLLTGKRPFPGKEDAEILTKVRRCEFTPPGQEKPKTPAALNAICVKAMAFKPEDRYQTALDLAADVEHWLADEPVAAYPEPLNVRLGRLARRFRTALVGAAVFLVSAVAALSISTYLIWIEQRETEKQRVMAVANYRMAREQLFESVELIQAADVDFASVPELHPRRRDILTGASRLCRESLKSNADDQEMQKRAAVVYRYLANVHRLSDETDAAGPLYADAVRLYGGLAEQLPGDAMYRERLSETLRDQSTYFFKLGQLKNAKENLERALKLVADLRKANPDRAPFQQTEANAVLNLALIAHRTGNDGEAKNGTDAAVEIFQKLADPQNLKRNPYNQLLLAGALNQAAVMAREDGDLKKARANHAAALNITKELSDKRPSRMAPADIASVKAVCALEQSRTLAKVADEKARKAAETNLGLNAQQWQALASNYPWIPYYRDLQAVALQVRGQMRLDDKQIDAAKKDFDESRPLLEKLVADHPAVAGYHADLGRTYEGLGRAARAQAQQDDAARWFGKARDALGKAVELSPDDVRWKKERDDLPK